MPAALTGTMPALLQIDNGRMLSPVKHGDTIRMHSRVLEKRESSMPDRGAVTFLRQCVKHDGTVVQEMKITLMYKRRTKD